MTKKDLFSYVNAFVVGILLFSSVALAQQDFRGNAVPAETVFTNGRIYTVDRKNPFAEAVAVKDGKFIEVGSAKDIEKFVGTGWGVIQAVSDMATHQQPSRKGINYQENLFAKTIDGHPMIDKAYEIVNAL
jgi:hypothetical protein